MVMLIRTDAKGAMRVGEVIRKSIEAMGLAMGFEPGLVTASVGVVGYDPERPGTDVLEEADKALYRAKAQGGNVVA